MIKIWLTFCLTFAVFTIKAQIPSGYYDQASGLSGEALKAALHNIIKGHHELSYDSVTIALRVTDQDTIDTSKVICLYTGWTYDKNDFGNGSENWNREHVWSKSHGDFGTNPPAGTDLHHLRPADASVNSAKNNRDFNWGITQYIDGAIPTDCYKDSGVWEPRDEVKGDVARMIFYMATRYEGDNGEVDLEIVDSVNTSLNKEPFYGMLSTLLAWNLGDPVSNWERYRNDTIYYHYQHNRNPFIDHPEYIDSIWGSGLVGEPSNHVTDFMVAATSDSSITLTWNNNDGDTIARHYLLMINQTGVFTAPDDGTVYSDDIDVSDGEGMYNISYHKQSYTWNNLPQGTTFYFTIYPYSNCNENTNYKTDGSIPQAHDSTDAKQNTAILIISEVTHPLNKATAKYVEITNIGNVDMDFSTETWYISIQSNGGTTWKDIPLTGFLKTDSSLTVAYSDAVFNTYYGFHPTIANGNITGNGNDGYFLYSGGDHLSGTLIDAYGVINQNGTGTSWEYKNSRAIRVFSVTNPDTTWQSGEWIIVNATTPEMTPAWHHRTLTWYGSLSHEVNNRLNWKDADNTTPAYPPDASCKLIFTTNGSNPEISTNSTFSVLELLPGATLTIKNGATLELIGK